MLPIGCKSFRRLCHCALACPPRLVCCVHSASPVVLNGIFSSVQELTHSLLLPQVADALLAAVLEPLEGSAAAPQAAPNLALVAEASEGHANPLSTAQSQQQPAPNGRSCSLGGKPALEKRKEAQLCSNSSSEWEESHEGESWPAHGTADAADLDDVSLIKLRQRMLAEHGYCTAPMLVPAAPLLFMDLALYLMTLLSLMVTTFR